jgi:hypothetical protein
MPNKDLKELREKLEAHLEESGEIRSDLKWCKKAIWTVAGGVLTFNVMLALAILNYIFRSR